MSAAAADTVLARILATKQAEVAAFRRRTDAAALAERVAAAPAPRGFGRALARAAPAAVIGEIKKASPSAGVIRDDFDVAWLAERYAAGGAAGLSVLTDATYFAGDDAFIAAARAACDLPVLRKDFVIDRVQIDAARALGADCVLLIAAALTHARMQELAERALALGMDVLAEVHDGAELERALALPAATLIGVNNRDLRTFETGLATSVELGARVPAGRIAISESGIHTPADLATLCAAGFGAFLIGESCMRQADPGAAVARLLATNPAAHHGQ